MNNIDVKYILNLIKEIGFLTYESNLVPLEFYYNDYVFRRTYNLNDVRAYFTLKKYCSEQHSYFLDDETDLNIVYCVLKKEFKNEIRKNKIAKFLNEST